MALHTAAALALALGVAGCGSPRAKAVPDVTGERLDKAEDELEQDGLQAREHSIEGGPILDSALWVVCDQWPAPGARAEVVELAAADDCLAFQPAPLEDDPRLA